MSDFGQGKTIKARKPHRCEWCYQTIWIGDNCYNYRGMWDGEWQNWYVHPECKAGGIDKLDYPSDGFMPGDGERPSV